MQRGAAMAILSGVAALVPIGLALAGRRRRGFASRAAEGAGPTLRDVVPSDPDRPRRKVVCAKPKGKHWVQMCMDYPGGPGPQVNTADRACSLLRKETGLDHADRESFYAVYMDVRNQVLGIEEISRGTLNGVEVHPREAFRGATLAGAAAVIFAHNHPSEDATPSEDDLSLTKRLSHIGGLIGIPVLDHLVIARPGSRGKGCTSICEERPSLCKGKED